MIEIKKRNGIGIVTMNRPTARNALTPELQYELNDKFCSISADPKIGAIVLCGAGGAFCAGGDVKAMAEIQTTSLDEQILDLRRREEIILSIRNAPQVVIAGICGPATGAGLALALACDIRICDTSARFGAVYAKVGLTGDFGISWLLQTEIGASHARKLLLDAEIIDAKKALLLGLVHTVTEPHELIRTVLARAEVYQGGPRIAYKMIKQNIFEAPGAGLAATLDYEAQRLVHAKQTKDHKQAISAFANKTRPVFQGK